MYYSRYSSPIGTLLLVGDDECLLNIDFPNALRPITLQPDWEHNDDPFNAIKAELDAYFNGTLTTFTIPVRPAGTEFQKSVWTALLNIDFGETRSYREIALAIEKPKAVRAVGAANGANPIPIVIPCHRVIGSNGALTGFGGGLASKQWLLSHEAGNLPLFPFEDC